MLSGVSVRNFAIIDEASLELGPGLTVLTGETGAGKSILVDALGLVLGDRADAAAVRHGAERAEITATFDDTSLSTERITELSKALAATNAEIEELEMKWMELAEME